MKKFVAIILSLFICALSNAQDNTDILYFIDGRTAPVYIEEVFVSEIICHYPNETIKCHISKSELSKIVFSSGREEIISHPQQNTQEVATTAGFLSAASESSSLSSKAKKDTVYVTPSGSAYHKSRSCSYLTNSSSVKAISIDEVGSKHPCSRCFGNSANSSAEKSTTSSNSSTKNTTPSGRTIYTGPRGGKYYINSSGKKVYVK